MSAPPLIAVCQHPYGEAEWFPVDGRGERCCNPECDCVPVVYARQDVRGDETTNAKAYGGGEAA